MRKVFEIGLGKTGTKSLTRAVAELGVSVAHGFPDKQYATDWFHKTLEARADFDLVSDHDFVSNCLAHAYRQLDKKWPDAKFILTVREIGSWLESCRNHFARDKRRWRMAHAGKLTPAVLLRLMQFGAVSFGYEHFRERYYTHVSEVTRYFMGSRLLIMDVCGGDGWEKLCPFLGKPIPDVPFPRISMGRDYLSKPIQECHDS